MDIKELRNEISEIDTQINELFAKRMNLSAKVAEYKKETNMPVFDKTREREIIKNVTENQPEELAEYTKMLYTTIMDLSRSYQNRILNTSSPLKEKIMKSLENTPKCFPKSATVACQGVEGAYSQMACDKLFSRPSIVYMSSFKGVFQAVDKNLCQYGILPIDNSLHGSVTEVYDLMKKYKFYIAREIKLCLNHALLTKNKINISEIKEVFSHEQGIGQCGEFLSGLKNVKINICENTAVAAKIIAESDRTDIAAISSKNCADLYSLEVLKDDIQDSDNNYTRFICISKNLEIYPGAHKITLMCTISHRPGSLYSLIAKFSAIGVNLTKLESRPIPGKDFEFMFYFEMDASIYSPEVVSLLSEFENGPDQFVFLGSYSEM